MSLHNLALSRRLAALERRVETIEDRLNIAPAPAPVFKSEAQESDEPDAPAPAIDSPTPLPPRAEPARAKPEPLPAREPQDETASLERFIGGRLFAVAGALIVIAGSGLGLKLAWDLGYFAQLSDAGKSMLMAAFGAALLIAGGVSRTRWGRAAGEGLTAAGLGVLFATVYAMVGPFDLLTRSHSLGALALVAAVGFWISARGGYIVAPAVAVVGAFLTPVLTGARETPDATLALYWLAVVALAYGLAAALGARFAAARAAAWWMAVTLGGFWCLAQASFGRPEWPLAFLTSVWAIVHLELWRAAAIAPRDPEWSTARLTRAIAGALTTTLWTVALGAIALNRLTDALHWILPASLAAASAVVARLVAPVGARLLREPTKPLEKLGVALALQAGALIVTAILIGGGDWTRAVAPLALGVAALSIARRFESAWLRLYALATLVVGTASAIDATHLIDGPAWTPGGLVLTEWSAIVALAGVAWMIGGWIERGRDVGVGAATGALGLFALAFLHDGVDGRWLAGAWAGLSALAVAAGRVAPSLRTACVGSMGLIISAGVWAAAYAFDWDAGPMLLPGVHEGLAMAVAFVALMIGAAVELIRGQSRDETNRAFGVLAALGAGVLLLIATSLEVSRLAGELLTDQTARRAALSIWWGVYAIGVLILGRMISVRPVRLAALALLGLATVKAVIWDLAAVAPGWRVASFLLLGLFLLGVATAYARSEARLRSGRSPSGPPAPTA